MNPSSTSDSMETAIEGNPAIRPKNCLERARGGVDAVIMAFCSESALTVYILFHWLMACASHIAFAEKDGSDGASFFCFLYFMATLISFLSIMSHVSGLLIPLFLFCSSASVVLFAITNLSMITAPGAGELYAHACAFDVTKIYCSTMEQHPTATLLQSYLLIFFFMVTCAAIVFQFARNDVYNLNPPPAFYGNQNFLFHPHMVAREVPIGAVNFDEPPRYSTLEPMEAPKPHGNTTTSTVTSPPRYSYWERTFGRQRSPSQLSSTTSKENSRIRE